MIVQKVDVYRENGLLQEIDVGR